MGIAAAASVTSQAVSILRPRLVAMLGMCCGFAHEKSSSPALFGDILVARETASWEQGKYIETSDGTGAFAPRSIIRTVDDTIGPIVANCVESANDSILPLLVKFLSSKQAKSLKETYGEALRLPPDIKAGMIVSGSSVIADEGQVSEILSRHPSAVGLEMEAYGIYTAVQKCIGRKPSVLGIKGVADFGTGKKHDQIQGYASVLSFYTLIAILRSIYLGEYIRPV